MKWIYVDVNNQQIQNIQNAIFESEWNEYGYEIEDNPHITIIPGFTGEFDEKDLPDINKSSVRVSGIRFYPSKSKPMVVMLDLAETKSLKRIRESAVDLIGESNLKYDLHPFHITLFKAGDSGDESSFMPPEDVTEEIIDNCSKVSVPDKIAISKIVFKRSSSYS